MTFFGRRCCRSRVVVAPNGMTSDCEFLNFNVIILSSTSLYAGGTISFEDDSFGILTSKWWISPSNLVPRSLVDEAEGNEIISLDSDPRIASYACALVCASVRRRVRHVYNRDAETGNWNFVLQLRTIRMQKMCQSQQFVTWDPSFCHPSVTPAQTFAGRKLKARRSSMMFFFH